MLRRVGAPTSRRVCRVGRYNDALTSNVAAIAIDHENAGLCLDTYLPEHNVHLLQYSASMSGQYGLMEKYSKMLWGYPETMGPSAWEGREWANLLLTQVTLQLAAYVFYVISSLWIVDCRLLCV